MSNLIEMPIGVEQDRKGKLAEMYTLKDWLTKIQEEAIEVQEEAQKLVSLGDRVGRMKRKPAFMERRALTEEGCDLITVVCSMLKQFGVTEEEIACGIHNVNVKNRNRGYLDKGFAS